MTIYSAKELGILTGATYRQIDYWARTHLIEPESSDFSRSSQWRAANRRYSERQVMVTAVATRLMALGLGRDAVGVATRAPLAGMRALRVGLAEGIELTVDLTLIRTQIETNRSQL